MIRIIAITDRVPEYRHIWNDYVIQKEEFNYSDLIEWGEIYKKVYGIKSNRFIALNDSRVTGVMTLYKCQNSPFKSHLVSCPRALGSFGGYHFDDEETKAALNNYLFRIFQKQKTLDYAEIRSIKSCKLPIEIQSNYANYYLMLNNDIDSYWKHQMKRKMKQSISKAKRFNLKVIFNESLSRFFNTLHIGMKRQGTPWHKVAFYKMAKEYFGEKMQFIGVRLGTKTISAMMVFRYKEDALTFIHHGSIKKYWPFQCNDLLYWSIIEYCYKNNIKCIDLGRSMQGSYKAKFKLKWGAQSCPIFYNYSTLKDNYKFNIYLDGISFKIATNIWKHLPVFVTKNTGHFFIRYLS